MGEIYNVSSNLPFLDSLAAGIVERFTAVDKVTIYLPNKRSVKPLAAAFSKYSTLLPKIEVIGEIDEVELNLHSFEGFKKIPRAISQTERLYLLAQLVHTKRPIKDFYPDFAQSVALSRSLIQLMDELQNMDLSFDSLEKVVPDEFAEHWQMTLDFLKVISEDWQNELKTKVVIEPITRRNRLIDKLAEIYHDSSPPEPVIIAGTTGTIPATQRLIKALIEQKNGFVVLRGLDRNLANDDFKILAETHPQYALSRLLESLNQQPDDVVEWQKDEITERQKYISAALFPTERTSEWQHLKCVNTGIAKVECANLEEEAMVVAIILREMLEQSNKTGIVVTNNRQLAERITTKMQIWNVSIADSAGQNLLKLPIASYLLELAEFLRQKQAPVALLSFFKHPFVPANLRQRIREIEKETLRGPRLENFDIGQHGIEITGLKEFAALFELTETNFLNMLEQHIKLAEEIGGEEIWQKDNSQEMQKFLNEFKSRINLKQLIDPQLYPVILSRFLAAKFYEPPDAAHPRLSILSPIEARMQNADLVVMCGLNEGDMPLLPEQDSFMNQQIRRSIGLYLTGMRIGQGAHDFELMSQAPNVVYTRSVKVGGTPTTKSRFLQRMEAVCEIPTAQKYLDWARGFYEPENYITISRPAPQPPVEARPTHYSATNVGKLMRDPYVIYANKILGLSKLDDIDADITAARFGNFIHTALERFSVQYDGQLATLFELGKQEFEPFKNMIGVKTFWWPKFLKIAEWFVENEAQVRRRGVRQLFEDKGKLQIGEMQFTAKADRLEIDGEMRIIDYKTGMPPSFNFVESGLDPQLTIEAIIFGKKYKIKVASLEYWYLQGRDKIVERKAYNNPDKLRKMIDAANVGLAQIAAKFLLADTPFIARPWSKHALKYNDYEHLERIKEWDE